jgi:hypothetical protein
MLPSGTYAMNPDVASVGVFLLAAVLIYLVLAAQFESFRDPFIILADPCRLLFPARYSFPSSD